MSSIQKQKLSPAERAAHRKTVHQYIAEKCDRESRESVLEWHRRRRERDSQEEHVAEESEHDA